MRAPEHQHVHTHVVQGVEILVRDELGRGVIEPALFDERHEQRAGAGVDGRVGADRLDRPLVGPAGDRAGRPDHADPSGLGRLRRRAGAGLDHADQRHGGAPPKIVERLRGDRVARDDQRLHAALHEVREDLRTVAPHGLGRLRAVGNARRVAEVDHRLVRQPLEQRARDGEPPDPGVEHPERRRIHGRGAGTLTRMPPGTACTFSSRGKSCR